MTRIDPHASTHPRHTAFRLPAAILSLLAIAGAAVAQTSAAIAAPAVEPVYALRLAQNPPPCTPRSDMPVVPNDPGALTAQGQRRCYGTQPPQLELWMPQGRYVWLEGGRANPAGWIRVGPLLLDLQQFDDPPLGLKLTVSRDAVTLESRYGQAATLSPLHPGRWQEVHAPDGGRFWAYLEADANGQALSRSTGATATPLPSQ